MIVYCSQIETERFPDCEKRIEDFRKVNLYLLTIKSIGWAI